MGLREWLSWQRLGLRLKRVRTELEREAQVNGYDVNITILKGLKGLGKGALAVLLAALLGYLGNAPAVTEALHQGGLSDALVAAAVPVIVGLASAMGNWAKHSGPRDDA